MISTTAKKITKATTKPMHNVKSVAANDDDGASIGGSVPYIVIVFNSAAKWERYTIMIILW